MTPIKNNAHERFAQLVASGKSQSEAYREVYPRSRHWRDESVHERSSKINAKVLPRVRELQSAIAERVCIEKAEGLAILADILRASPSDIDKKSRCAQEMTVDPVSGKVTIRLPSKIAAFSELAKALGWYFPIKSEVAFDLPPHADVERLLKERLDKIRAKK